MKQCYALTFVFAVQPQITHISGEVVTEGGNVTLNCLSEGNPPPSFTWTRVSDNSVVTMPLTNIRRQDAGQYRCTAVNGVGTPATRDVFIDVQCESYLELFLKLINSDLYLIPCKIL